MPLLQIAESCLDASGDRLAFGDTKTRDVVWRQELAAERPWSRNLSATGSTVAMGDSRSSAAEAEAGPR